VGDSRVANQFFADLGGSFGIPLSTLMMESGEETECEHPRRQWGERQRQDRDVVIRRIDPSPSTPDAQQSLSREQENHLASDTQEPGGGHSVRGWAAGTRWEVEELAREVRSSLVGYDTRQLL
jgi:hypothetical protein